MLYKLAAAAGLQSFSTSGAVGITIAVVVFRRRGRSNMKSPTDLQPRLTLRFPACAREGLFVFVLGNAGHVCRCFMVVPALSPQHADDADDETSPTITPSTGQTS